jgi:hypothetical protein
VLIGNDPVCTEHPRIMKASEAFPQAERLRKDLIKLQDAIARHDVGPVRDLLRELVPEYAAAPQVVDWIAEQERLAGRAGPAQSQASPSNFQFDNGPLRL